MKKQRSGIHNAQETGGATNWERPEAGHTHSCRALLAEFPRTRLSVKDPWGAPPILPSRGPSCYLPGGRGVLWGGCHAKNKG